MKKNNICLTKTFTRLSCVLLISGILNACGGSSSNNVADIPDSVSPPPVVLTPEREGQSVARMWNEVLLLAIRNDFARPTIHARNLFHVSSAMFDAWSVYKGQTKGFLLGNQVGEFSCPLASLELPQDVLPDQEQAISFATYRIIKQP